MTVETETNNQKAPTLEGQGNEAGNEEVVEETTDPVGGEEKGTPDDPKLLRAKMTQATQETAESKKAEAEAKKELAEYKVKMGSLARHPKFKPLYEEVVDGKTPEPKEPEEMTDDERQVYKNMKPYLNRYLKEQGMSPEQFKQDRELTQKEKVEAATREIADRFYAAHPEVEVGGEISNAVAGIMNESKKNNEVISPETAYKLYKVDNADAVAKSKVTKELETKKGASLLKPKGTAPATKPERNMSQRESVEAAMEEVGE